ncbi:hypothetical protein [Paraliobacillus ryukyuensis]|uniref:hypothetical protein n=1 Tax=Paraliobacillus ryukyuensis TaxID=200904 RepID=UPI0009A810C2|nr:hypothetical protein [Paraliobacillus ryukyuensis]
MDRTKSIEERIGVLEYASEDQERRLRIQEENNRALIEISQFVKLQTEHNERQERQMENVTNIMSTVQNDVSSLKGDVGYVKSSVNSVTKDVEKMKKEDLQELKQFKSKSWDFYLKIAAGVILAALLFYLGLK